jgi:AcrR family transcriptional regulator
MGIHERREREKEQVRSRIIEAGRDLLSEQGLAGLSMRGIADRIEYSPATIYLYFRDKEELVREIVRAGFEQLGRYSEAGVAALGPSATGAARFSAMGLAYARFALENTAYFRVMFELPGVAQLECGADCPEPESGPEGGFGNVIEAVRQAQAEGSIEVADAERTAVVGWGLIHGLTSLYLSGHLGPGLRTHEEFLELIDYSMQSLFGGWGPLPERDAVKRKGGRNRRQSA